MKEELVYTVNEESELEAISKEIIQKLTSKIILLHGEMGSGKTTFTQYLVKNLGLQDAVNSPTYSIVNEYGSGDEKVYHFDLYRLETPEQVFEIGMEDYLTSNHYCLIEWPEIYMQEIAENYNEIFIFMNGNRREIKLSI